MTTPNERLLEVAGLTARYGPIVALRDVELEARRGEIVAILGANGAGKTTTLASIAGLVGSREGRILFAGQDVSRLLPEQVVRLGISLTPEGRRLFAGLSVAENLALGAAVRGRDPQVAADRQELLELFPILAARLHLPAGALSGGEQQQLAIARSLMSRPQLLLLDEPTLGLAPLLVRQIFELIVRLRAERGLTIVLVEQNVHQALDICDRAYVLRAGQVALEGTPAELRRSTEIEEAYLGVGEWGSV